jgi:hypothetical protein
MLGVYSGFRRDDDNDSMTAAATSMRGSSEPAMSDTVAGTSGSVVEEPLEESVDKQSFCSRRRPWPCVACGVVVLMLLMLLVLLLWMLLAGEHEKNGAPALADDATRTPSPSFLRTTPSQAPSVVSLATSLPTTSQPPSPQPFVVPSSGPSTFPSSAPTALRFADMVEQIEGLLQLTVPREDASDPRWEAVAWLATQDQVVWVAAADAAAEGSSAAAFRYSRRLAQRYVLAVLYYSTGGPEGWTDACSFLDPTLHECDWKCSPPPAGHWKEALSSLGLATAGVSCYSFPDFADEMEYLILGTFCHRWSGPCVDYLGYILNSRLLCYIVIADNQLAGSLPTELSELIALRGLWLFDNALTGTIPEVMAGIPFLENVRLEGNQLRGSPLPWEQWEAFSQLREWRASGNLFSGDLPRDWRNVSRLQVLDLGHNRIGGDLSTDLWSLPQLRQVLLPNNQLMGSLPPSLGSNLELVELGQNQLNGRLPSNMTDSMNLLVLHLDDNLFAGSVPQNWAELPDLGKSP